MDFLATFSSDTEKISLPWKWQPVKRRMLPGCELFADGDARLHLARKFVPLDLDEERDKDGINVENESIPCGVVGCMQSFSSLLAYENHYNSLHRHSCITCHQSFPSAFLLDLHIQENHDPLFAILVEKQHMYRCLVEICENKFATPDARRQHVVKVHHYPANFRFSRLRPTPRLPRLMKQHTPGDGMGMDNADRPRVKTAADNDGLPTLNTSQRLPFSEDGHSQCGGSSDKENQTAVKKRGASEREGATGMEVEETSGKAGAAPQRVFVHKVPQSFSFGHGVSRGFHRVRGKKKVRGKHWHQQGAGDGRETTTNIENVDMNELAAALD